MQVVKQLQELNEALSTESNKSIGFVPTMGFLHHGHLSLINASKKKADFTVVSIFVNPTQFNNPTDLENYPVSLKEDLMTLEKQEVDLVFCPDYNTLYTNEKPVEITLGKLDSVLEARKRKGCGCFYEKADGRGGGYNFLYIVVFFIHFNIFLIHVYAISYIFIHF